MAMGTPKQVALFVGASRGIGRQVAIDLAKNGFAGKLDHLHVPDDVTEVHV
jgi:NAD(P)-dependent dehydrogenase (short-subunit alcohol dehydrogenase family)